MPPTIIGAMMLTKISSMVFTSFLVDVRLGSIGDYDIVSFFMSRNKIRSCFNVDASVRLVARNILASPKRLLILS